MNFITWYTLISNHSVWHLKSSSKYGIKASTWHLGKLAASEHVKNCVYVLHTCAWNCTLTRFTVEAHIFFTTMIFLVDLSVFSIFMLTCTSIIFYHVELHHLKICQFQKCSSTFFLRRHLGISSARSIEAVSTAADPYGPKGSLHQVASTVLHQETRYPSSKRGSYVDHLDYVWKLLDSGFKLVGQESPCSSWRCLGQSNPPTLHSHLLPNISL